MPSSRTGASVVRGSERCQPCLFYLDGVYAIVGTFLRLLSCRVQMDMALSFGLALG